MKLGRRAFLQHLGIGVVAAPAAAKQVVDKAAADLAGLNVVGSAGIDAPPSAPYPSADATDVLKHRKTLRHLLTNPVLRDEYVSAMFVRNRHVGTLDLDLANKVSFSLAAKVTFQRQRNVARQIDEDSHEDGPFWQRPDGLIRKAASLLFGL